MALSFATTTTTWIKTSPYLQVKLSLHLASQYLSLSHSVMASILLYVVFISIAYSITL